MIFAKTIAFTFSFALPLVLVRRLSLAEFGLYKQAFLAVGSAIMVLPIGFHMSAYYYLPRENKERQGLIVFNILIFFFVVGGLTCLVILLRPTLLATLLGSAELIDLAPLIGLVVLTWVVSSFLETAAIANQEVRLATIFIIVVNVTRTCLMLSATLVFASVEALLYAALIQGTLQTITLLLYLRTRFEGFWRRFDWSVMRMQLAYSLPLGIAATILRFQIDLDSYFVSNQFGATALAIYSVGCFNIPLFFLISDAVGSVMIPRISYLQQAGERREILEVLARMIRKLSAIGLPLYVLLLIVGREFITVLFTAQYLASWPIFAINLAQIPLSIVASGYDPVMRAFAEQRFFLLRVRLALLGLLILALWLFTKRVGMVGAVSMVVGLSFFERLIISFRVGRILHFSARDIVLFKDVGKICLAVLIAGVVTMIARSVMLEMKPFFILTACGAIFSLVYLIAMMLLGVFTQNEKEMMRFQVARLPSYIRWETKRMER